MTPHPQQEYIVTDEDFEFIWKNMGDWLVVRDRINVIKSRKPPTPAAPNQCYHTGFEDGRNQTLDVIVEFTKGNSETIEADDGTLEDAVFLGELLAKIESLRTPSTQEQRGDQR